MEEDDNLALWRLCETLTVQEAACLIAGADPAEVDSVENAGFYKADGTFTRYMAAKTAIFRALEADRLKGKILVDTDGFGVPFNNINQSTVEVESLRDWLRQRGVTNGFFFHDAKVPDYMNPEHPRYAPKLAAAVSAWLAAGEVAGRSPKETLKKWLREHAAQFGLTKEDGSPNEQGIEEVAKVANWQFGGAPKTPG
ncbi:hypothetical protein LCC91_09985 [Tepidimonas taiwanensis]|nr:hypothetical protein [Tepidimonas taiwanensis]UBQ04885.1 hypothetical protein LCC91_09985 [Tepidimonas taiwanensis]